jgi:Uma2 family endonuclease
VCRGCGVSIATIGFPTSAASILRAARRMVSPSGMGLIVGAEGGRARLILGVAMEATAKRITAEEYFEISVEGDRTQLIDGVLVMDQPRMIHGVLQARIAAALQNWIDDGRGNGLASMPTDVVMDEQNVYGPDVLWIAERHRPADLRKRLERVPELCVEIRSPCTWHFDIGEKKRIYEAGGLPELWLVDDVSARAYVFGRSAPEVDHFDVALELARDDVLRSPQLPSFELPLERLFRR